ncbi:MULTISPECIES: hypothetical protein [Bacillus cereus group]|uniref:hypothetical protein n=1 Tax=Bacillus cereus group TaxID=86661 RepID=UPI0005CEBDBE|nr:MULTISPECIES: hypothetical protein [Bacillus cereus group]
MNRSQKKDLLKKELVHLILSPLNITENFFHQMAKNHLEAHIDLLLCFQDNVTLFEIAKLYECPQTVMCKVIKLEKELTNSHKGANTSYLNSIEQTITTLRKYYKECNGKVTDTQLEPISRLQKRLHEYYVGQLLLSKR